MDQTIKKSRYLFLLGLGFLIFIFLGFGNVNASEDPHSPGGQITHSEDADGHETEHNSKDKSGDLLDLLYRVINFALLVIILAFVIRKTSIKDFFKNRSEEIKRKMEDLQSEKEEAEKRYKDIERQLKDFETKRQEIIDQYKSEGLTEKNKIISEAEERVEQILKQSEITINQEIQAARDRLKNEVVDLAAKKAQEIISNKLNEKDQDLLIDEFIERVGKVH